MRVEILTSIHEIKPEEWNKLCPEPTFTHAWHDLIESTLATQVKPRHLILKEGNQVYAILPCYLHQGDPHYDLHARVFGPFAEALPKMGLKLQPALLAYSPLGNKTQYFHLDSITSNRVISLFSKAMEDFCASENIPVSGFLFVEEWDLPFVEGLAKNRFHRMFVGHAASIQPKFSSFNAYLEYIKKQSNHRYRNARYDLNCFKRTGYTLAQEPLESVSDEELYSFYRNHHERRHPGTAVSLSSDFFKALKEKALDNIILHTVRDKHGHLISYHMMVQEGANWHAFLLGQIADEKAHKNKVHFNLAYFYAIEEAIKLRIESIHYGLAASVAKGQRGCDMEPISLFLRFHRPHLKVVMPVWMFLADVYYRFKHRKNKIYLGKRPQRQHPENWTPNDPLWKQAWIAMNHKGLMPVLKKGFAVFLKIFFERSNLIFCRASLTEDLEIQMPPTRFQIEVETLKKENLDTLRPITSKKMFQLFTHYAQEGYECFVAKIHGKIAAYNWYATTPYRSPQTKITFPLADQEVFIVYSNTLRAWRGRGIDAYLKAKKLTDYQRLGYRSIGTTIEENNRNSFRTMGRWKSLPELKYEYFRVFGWSWAKVTKVPSDDKQYLRNLMGPLPRPFIRKRTPVDPQKISPGEKRYVNR